LKRVLYIDCFAGASGDMFLGALLDLGVPVTAITDEVHKLGLKDVDLRHEREARHGIGGVRAHVLCGGREILEGEGIRAAHKKRGPDDREAHSHSHAARPPCGEPGARSQAGESEGTEIEAHGPEHVAQGRRYLEIEEQLVSAGLGKRTGELARKAFRRLAEAEAKVHGVAVEEVHFHELGAVDALVDVVGACAAVAHLAPDEIVASPVPLARGMILSAHGRIPLPAPATLEILTGVPVVGLEEEGETVTPTGAVLLWALADRFGPIPRMRLWAVGHGVGARDPRFRPNLLRLLWGSAPEEPSLERLWVLEANIDDMNPQIFEHLTEALLAKGARDVWLCPAQMKKGRPATVLSVLCEGHLRDELVRLIMRESTSIGVRFHEVERRALTREVRPIETPFGTVRVKYALDGAEVVNVAPEYEDCRRLARDQGVPLKEVFQAALRASPGGVGHE
jgi:uncharacterized protein (TIGR00299 family) protein